MRPRLLLHCQHSLGLGHLVRSLALASGLAERFDVTLLNGGRLPDGTTVPDGVELVDLPSLGHDAEHRLVSHEPGRTVEEVAAERTQLVVSAFGRLRPDAVVVELYPFGRRKFEFELVPLLDAAVASPRRPVVVSSVRDILVGRDDGGRHDDRAAVRAHRYLDAVLVHSDPVFARFEESFRPTAPLRVPVLHTGFVVAPSARPSEPRSRRVIVSVGGGMVGEALLTMAALAAPTVLARTGLTTTLVLGPFLPAEARQRVRAAAPCAAEVVERVDDLRGEIARSTVSVSQAGYNTTMDVLQAGRPAVVVPFAAEGEDEQTRRAERIAALGLWRVVPETDLTPDRLADAVVAAVDATPPAARLDLGGRERSAAIVADLVVRRRVAS
jgi:predicted glycosyltransferase